jgi:lipoprotein-releasing system permease protein
LAPANNSFSLKQFHCFMHTGFFIARKIVFNRQPSFSRFIIRLATAATALSVGVIIITISMINGFQHTVSEKVYSFWGHIRVNELQPFRSSVSEESPISLTTEMEERISEMPGLQHFHSFGTRSVVMRTPGRFEGLLLKGIDRRFAQSDFAARFLRSGKMIAYPDTGYSNDILISDQLAAMLELKVGSTVQLFFLRNDEAIRQRTARIAGLYHTGIEEYDKQFALADLGFLQRLSQWQPNQAAGYEIWIQESGQSQSTAKKLYDQLPQGVAATPVAAIYPNIFDWLQIQDQTRKVVIGVMLAVAIINLLTCLLILVMERTRMVGVLSALGMQQRQIRQIFWIYAAWIAGVGIGIGLAFALGLLWLQQESGIIRLDEATYYVDRMPVQIVWWQVGAVVTGAFLVCLLALRLPLYYTRRISVVKALRFS